MLLLPEVEISFKAADLVTLKVFLKKKVKMVKNAEWVILKDNERIISGCALLLLQA